MIYESAIIVTRPATSSDGMGGYVEGGEGGFSSGFSNGFQSQQDETHVYSGYVDVQELGERFNRLTGALSDEGDARVFLDEAATDVPTCGIAPGDEMTIVWNRGDIDTDSSGTPTEGTGGIWSHSGSDVTTASVARLRRLDNHIVVNYS